MEEKKTFSLSNTQGLNSQNFTRQIRKIFHNFKMLYQ